MSLTASMWTGVSGLMGHNQKMSVVGNNIANVSTVGFKSQRMDFADFMYANQQSLAGNKQVGRGVRVGTVMTDFSQGAFETTNSAIDLAIGGAGFFRVQPIGSEEAFYTRAGNMSFTKDGYLVDPNGYALQGWKIDNSGNMTLAAMSASTTITANNPIKGTGTPTDIRLDTWTVPPQATTTTNMFVNLSKTGVDNSKNYTNPFASMVEAWDGTQEPPISESAYAYSSSIKVYDEGGRAYTMTVYYDYVSDNSYDGADGESMWEYMVTINPADDNRQVWDASLNGGTGGLVDLNTTKMGGIMMSGTMTFNSSGTMTNQTAYTLMGNIPNATNAAGDPTDDPQYYHWDTTVAGKTQNLVPIVADTSTTDGILGSFYPASISSNGYPLAAFNFGGNGGAQSTASPNAVGNMMEINLGMKVTDYQNSWTVSDTTSLLTATTSAPHAAQNGYLTSNQYWSKDGSNGPKVVEANPNFDPELLSDYLEMIAEMAADPTSTAWADFNTKWSPVYPVATDLNEATWPYYTDPDTLMATPFDNTQAHRQLFADHTPTASDIGFMREPARQANATTMMGESYSTSSGTGQNGYTFGNLTSYDVDSDGILYGIYSNGVTLGLYQITLYDFVAEQGLYHEGNNLYSATRDSGEAFYGAAGTNGMGTVASYTLESSNVDLSREFVNMITTQRGFQSNSKIITTVDTMMEQVIQMKR